MAAAAAVDRKLQGFGPKFDVGQHCIPDCPVMMRMVNGLFLDINYEKLKYLVRYLLMLRIPFQVMLDVVIALNVVGFVVSILFCDYE